MKNIVMIIPYFGEWPGYFSFFLKSIKYNPKVDFMFITDNEIKDAPQNVILKKMTFNQFVTKVQSLFDFRINLKDPYKLVDYKPAYGYVFEKEIKKYKMWGYCDIDVIFGDIIRMLPNEYEKYDKLFSLGHFTLFKNNSVNNRLFMSRQVMDYRHVFQTDYIHVFDEIHGVEDIFQINNKKVFNDNVFADISWKKKHFERVYNQDIVTHDRNYHNQNYSTYLWSKGKIYGISVDENNTLQYVELMYIHFQKRNLTGKKILLEKERPFLITYKGFEDYDSVNINYQIMRINRAPFLLEIKSYIEYLYYIWKRRFNKYLLRK